MKTLEIIEKNAEKLRGYTYKIIRISAASCPKLSNLVQNWC